MCLRTPPSLAGEMRAFIQREGLDESPFKAFLRKLDFSLCPAGEALGGPQPRAEEEKSSWPGASASRLTCISGMSPLNYVDLISRTQIEVLIEGIPAHHAVCGA